LRDEKLNGLAFSHNYSILITKTFVALHEKRVLQARKRERFEKAEEFLHCKVQPSQVLSVLIALQKFTYKQRNERKAQEFRIGGLIQKSLLALSSHVATRREDRQKHYEAVSIYEHKLK